MSQSLRKSGQFLLGGLSMKRDIYKESQSLRKSGQFLCGWDKENKEEGVMKSQSLRKSGQFLC